MGGRGSGLMKPGGRGRGEEKYLGIKPLLDPFQAPGGLHPSLTPGPQRGEGAVILDLEGAEL